MKKIIFRKFMIRKDLEILYRIMSDPMEQINIQRKASYNSTVEFEEWILEQLKGHFHDFYILEDIEKHRVAGFVYSYDFRISDGHCMICVYVMAEYRNLGVGAMCSLQFLDELFRDYPMRKIYLSIYDYNRQSLQSNLHAGFREEGCFKEYRYFNGKYWDMHILAIDRNTFYKLHGHRVGNRPFDLEDKQSYKRLIFQENERKEKKSEISRL